MGRLTEYIHFMNCERIDRNHIKNAYVYFEPLPSDEKKRNELRNELRKEVRKQKKRNKDIFG